MLATHLINRTKISNPCNGYSLPGFRDFLREVEPGKPGPSGSLPNNETSTAACSGKPKSLIDQNNLYKCFLTHSTCLPTPDSVFVLPESSLESQGVGSPRITYGQNNYLTVSGRSQNHIPLEKDAGLPVRLYGAISPFRLGHRPQPQVIAPEEPRPQPETNSHRSPSGKIASNHKHKESEKYRRDEMGAYVQAAEFIRGSFHPGILSDCSFCIANTLLNEKLCPISMVSASVAVVTSGTTTKRTRNQTLEEALMWQFSIVLHFRPEDVGSRLDDIRAIADQIRSEKLNIKASESTKNDKAATDARVEVLTEILQKMRHACELHNVPHCACGRHEIEDLDTDSLAALATSKGSSLCSTSSSVTGQKRSRTTTSEDDEDDDVRRVRRRKIVDL